MILKVFSVYDTASAAYLQPFFTPTTGLAVRSFSDAVNDTNHQFSKHVADYSLYLLGEFDDNNGTFTAQPEPVRIATARETLLKDITPSPK